MPENKNVILEVQDLKMKFGKLEVLKDHLIRNFCVYGECSEKDWEDINGILERARKEM